MNTLSHNILRTVVHFRVNIIDDVYHTKCNTDIRRISYIRIVTILT